LDSGRRNFHAVWPSLLATSMGLMAFLPVLPLYVHERFLIPDGPELAFWAAAIYGAAPLAAGLVGPLWGSLGDRTGKKPMAIRANVGIALTTALMPLMPSPLALLAMRALQGALAGYVAPAMALATQALPRAQHGRAIAKLQVAMAAGSFLGPSIAGDVAHALGRPALFWLTSALALVAALQLHLFAHEPPRAAAAARGSFLGDFGRSSLQLLRQPAVGGLLALLLVLRLGQNMLEPLVALLVRRLGPLARLADDPALALDRTIGLSFMLLAFAQWAFTPWWGRKADRYGPLRCLAVLAVGLGVLQALLLLVDTTVQFLLLRGAIACLMAGSMTLAYAAVSKRVADEHRTLAFAMVQSCIQLGLALGPVLGSAVAGGRDGALEFGAVFATAAALCGTAGVGMFVLRARTAVRPVAAAGAPPAPLE
jgi:DHA1 family multidrug resistance protein-like MFS transporter